MAKQIPIGGKGRSGLLQISLERECFAGVRKWPDYRYPQMQQDDDNIVGIFNSGASSNARENSTPQ